ncbi:MAG: hypothetical protein Q8Q50_08505 [Methylobacter sp.]|nr:hypothetical protein [Methylobacter sp.]
MNANALTRTINAAMLPHVALIGGTGLQSWNVAAQPQSCGFFVQKISVHHVMADWAEHLQGWPVATPVLQLRSVCHQMIAVVWRQVYNLIRVAAMNHHSKTPNLISYFNVYHFSQLIAENVPGSRAINFKLFNPALCVKFARMGALS